MNENGNHQGDDAEQLPTHDTSKSPQFIPARAGTRMFSLAALIERVIAQFVREHGDSSPALNEAVTKADRLKLLRDSMQYVLAVESVMASLVEQAEIMRQAYSELFAYGPLDALLEEDHITTIALEGWQKVAVRQGHDELTVAEPLFESYEQFNRIIARLIRNANAQLRPDVPYLETGLVIDGRRVCVTLFTPPAVSEITVVLRLHPRTLPPLENMVQSEKARQLITAIARSAHGAVIIGEVETGKTTLLAHLARLAGVSNGIAVERAGELHLPEGIKRLTVQWDIDDEGGITFSDQIRAALESNPSLLLLDEVRNDEPGIINPLLMMPDPPRLLWTFRGTTNSKRLAAAFGILVRMRDTANGDALMHALYERAPFVLAVRRREGRLMLQSVAEWQFHPDSDYPALVELMATGADGLEMTGKPSTRVLDLPADFWG